MSECGHLWAVGFDDTTRAEQVREKVRRLAGEHSLILHDTAVVVRHPDGTVTLDGEPFLTSPGIRGRSFAGLLAGLALAAPVLTGAAVGLLQSATCAASEDVGISEHFIREVEKMIKRGTSALFVLDQARDLDAILQGIQGLGGTVLRTSVDLQRARLIQSALDNQRNHP